MSSHREGAVSRVAANSFWYGLDSLLGIVMAFAVSVPMARVFGPEKLGYFNYIMWLTTISGVASLGMPQTTCKYMAEFLGSGQPGLARAVYHRSLWIQGMMAVTITVAALIALYAFGDPKHHLVSTIQIVTIIPGMLVHIPTQANLANESMRSNIPGSMVSNLIVLISIPLCLLMHWDLEGIAIGMLLSKIGDLAIRWNSTHKWVSRAETIPLSPELKRHMWRFGLQVTYMSVVAMVIWDKSDLVFLKALSPDIREIAYFTVAFNLAEKAVLAPSVFAASLHASILAQFGRDRSRMAGMATAATRYLFLFSMPVLCGLALMSSPLISFVYGKRFLPAIPVLQCAAALAVTKPLAYPVDAVFKATGRQKQSLVWTTVCAVLNIALDYLLIPHLGAVGAATASGLAVSSQVVILMILGALYFEVSVDFAGMAKIAFATACMALVVMPMNGVLPPLAAIVLSPLAGGTVFILVLRTVGALKPEDTDRLGRLVSVFPSFLRPIASRTVAFLGKA